MVQQVGTTFKVLGYILVLKHAKNKCVNSWFIVINKNWVELSGSIIIPVGIT